MTVLIELEPSHIPKEILHAASLSLRRNRNHWPQAFSDLAGRSSAGTINLIAGPNLTHSADVIHAESIPDVSSQGGPHTFSNLGVATVTSNPTVQNAMTALDAEQRSHIVTIEDERYVYALTTSDYLRGFVDAADTIAKGVGAASTSTAAVAEKIAPAAIYESQTTWGLQLTGVVSSS